MPSLKEFQEQKEREKQEAAVKAAERAAPAAEPVKKPGLSLRRIREFFHDPSYTMPGGIRFNAYSEFELWRMEKFWPMVGRVLKWMLLVTFVVLFFEIFCARTS
jgi:hypothetical protein